jgi:hypothetical protein
MLRKSGFGIEKIWRRTSLVSNGEGEMPHNTVYVTVLLQVLLCGSAVACEGQVGNVIFEDTFPDDTGGWDFTPPATAVNPPNFVFTLSSKLTSVASQNLTFHATDADYCAEVILPKSLAPDNTYGFGVEFWAVDYNNFWMAMLASNGSIALYSRTNGVWQTIEMVPNAPGLKPEPDAVNALRVTTVGGKISIYLNGQLVKAVRAQIPQGNLRFGMYSQIDKGVDGAAPILVKTYKVTSGQ